MKSNETALRIVEGLGGSSNVRSFTHCATRLRFDISDSSKINQDELSAVKEVLGVVDKGGTFQLIIGPSVENLYHQIVPLLKEVAEEKPVVDEKIEETTKRKGGRKRLDDVMSYVSGAIQPTLPVLIGAGMINAILAVSVLFGLDKAGGTYTSLSALAGIAFTYLPVFVAFAAARKLGTDEYVAAFLSLAMIVCFNQQETLSIFSVAIPNVKYANSIVPVLFMIPVQKIIDRACNKYVPSAAHFTVKPLIITLIMAPIILFVFGPIGALIGGALANMCIWLMEAVGPLAMAVLAALHPITVMFGMHYLFTPIMTNEIAELGYSFVLGRALAANFAIAGSALAVGLRAKRIENKSVGYSSSITALVSVTEPALYGCLIRLKKPLICACAAAGVSGLFLGLFQVKAYAIASPSLLSLPIYIGGEGMSNFILACIGAAIGFGLGFLFTYLLGFDEEK